MTAKHAPTPWEFFECVSPRDGGIDYRLESQNGYRIGEVSNFNGSEVNAANAAFIVRAVNAHDDLVAALKAARDSIVGLADDIPSAAWITDPFYAEASPLGQINAALVKAEAL